MKCTYCNAEWNIPGQTVTPENCPFCGKKLIESALDTVNTLQEALLKIVTSFGVNLLKDGKKTLGLFLDLAPSLKREQKMYSYFVQSNGHVCLLDALCAPRSEQEVCYHRVVHYMVENLLIDETIALEVCDAFWKAIGGKPFLKHNIINTDATTNKRRMVSTAESLSCAENNVSQSEKKPILSGKVTTNSLDYSNYKDFKITGRTLVKYYGHDSVVNVPDGIRIIGKRAFEGNFAIKEVKLPESVQKIKEGAFQRCLNLHTLNLPAGLLELGDYAFSDSKIKCISIPPNLRLFGRYVFSDTALETVVVPGIIKNVPEGTFERCRSLSEVVLNMGVSKIDRGAFDNCPRLETITIPDTLETITSGFIAHIFDGTNNIQKVIAGEQWIRSYPDYYLEMIPSENEADNYLIKDNVLVRYYGRAARPTIPSGVQCIGPYAFEHNPYVIEISIPEGVQRVARGAFWRCDNLRRLSLPSSLICIDDHAFWHCVY